MSDKEINPNNTPPEPPSFYDEKAEEKMEKEKERIEEKHHRDRLGDLVWALILIWAGLVFLASNLGWLNAIQTSLALPQGFHSGGLSTWSMIFLGAGVLVFIEALVRTFVPAYRSATSGTFILAAVFLGIGLSAIFGWNVVWPFILIAMGLSALLSALMRKR